MKPEPVPGLVIRYDYLWRAEARRGRREGGKIRPCAIVISRRMGPTGRLMVLLAAVTHSRPVDGVLAVEMPSAVKRHLGLDDNRSWIVVSEVNAVAWSDRGIVPVEADRWTYGELPPKLVRTLVDLIVAEFDANRLHVIQRDQG